MRRAQGITRSSEIHTSKLEELRVVHQPLARHDQAEKIAGTTRYAGDLAFAGMLHARLVRSQVPSARLTRRDVTAAAAVPGVIAVLLGEDVPNNEIRVDVPGQTIAVGALKASMQVLATDRVRFHGEPIALVIAETEDALAVACDLVEVEYEDLPVVSDPEAALADDAPSVHEGGNLLAEWHIDRGDVDAAFTGAAVVVEETYRTQFVDHAYLEPEAGVGWLDDDGVLNLRVATQVIEHYRDVAKILGVPDAKVRVIAPYVGGGFGGKEDMTVEPYLAIAVHRTRRPVRMLWTRNESLLARAKRHRNVMRYRTAADAEGTLLAHDIEIVSDAGAYAYLSALVLLYSTVHACGPYRVPNVRIRARTAYTNNPPTSAFRGFGGMQMVLGYESQIDEVARRLGIDPGEIRKRNALARGDRLPVGQEIITEVQLAQTIDAVRERAGDKPAPSGPRKAVGRAIASNMQSYGRLVWLNDSSAAWIGFQMDGSLTVRCGVPDIGGGQASSLGADRERGPGGGHGSDQRALRRFGADAARGHDHRDPAAADVGQRHLRGGRPAARSGARRRRGRDRAAGGVVAHRAGRDRGSGGRHAPARRAADLPAPQRADRGAGDVLRAEGQGGHARPGGRSDLPGLHVRHAPGRRGGRSGHRPGAGAAVHRGPRRRPRDQPDERRGPDRRRGRARASARRCSRTWSCRTA